MTRVSLAFLLVAATALPAHAELCRFPALDAENPFRRWLGSQEVTCVEAGAPMDLPSGLWNVFVRTAGAISTSPLLVDGAAPPAQLDPPLAPAAGLALTLPEKQTAVIYVPRRGSAFPVDGPRMSVPADEPLWLFVLDHAVLAAVLPIAPLPPGTERSIDARGGGPPAVIGWLQVAEAERTALPMTTGVTAPAVRAGTHDADPLPSPSLLHGAFFRVTEVATGNAELRLEGRGWLPDRRVVKVQPGVTVAAVPLVVRAAGTLTVYWNSDDDLPALDRDLGSCSNTDPPELVITIAKCSPPRRGQPVGDPECAPLREEKAERLYGSVSFDDVAPGLYRAEMRYGKLPPASAMATVRPLQVTDLRVHASYYTIYGSVTRGGEPLGERVRIDFPGGTGFAPADTDEYRAVFLPAFLDTETQIKVAACDGSPRAVVLTDRPMRPRANFDIDIPANELVLQVNDTFTREALPGATVKLDAMALRSPRVVFTANETSGEQGHVTWTGLPVRELHLTVTRAGYEKRTIDPFTMPARGQVTKDVQLVPLRGTRGKIVSDRPFDGATVLWFSPTGSETERVDLAADGTFVYTNWHTPEETMAVVSAAHPLWVLHTPATERRGSISLRFPNAPPVAFDVWLAAAVPAGETRHIGLAIGSIPVPQPALEQHQTLRRDPPLLRGAGPQHFRDVLATGPIDVLYGPKPGEVPSRAQNLDLFVLSAFANAPRQRLTPGTTDVILPTTPAPTP